MVVEEEAARVQQAGLSISSATGDEDGLGLETGNVGGEGSGEGFGIRRGFGIGGQDNFSPFLAGFLRAKGFLAMPVHHMIFVGTGVTKEKFAAERTLFLFGNMRQTSKTHSGSLREQTNRRDFFTIRMLDQNWRALPLKKSNAVRSEIRQRDRKGLGHGDG